MNRFYVSKPYIIGLDKCGLKYVDILTYVAIKSFNNHQTNSCFPAHETVAALIGASRSFVMGSVKRLINSGYISKISQYRSSNRYYFRNFGGVTKIPPEIFRLDLTIYEKAMLIVLRQFCEGTPVLLWRDITWISKQLGVTYKTVYTQVKSLIAKGYVEERLLSQKKYCGYKLTELVDWFYIWDIPKGNEKPVEPEMLIIIT